MANPERTCVACRLRASKNSLTRLVFDPDSGAVVVDARQRLPGRGAYLHPACATRAARSRVIGRALRRSVDGAQVSGLAAQLDVIGSDAQAI